jgi:FkbM family methyltransferase
VTAPAENHELAVVEAERGNWEAAERHARAAVTDGGDQYAGCLGKILTQTGKLAQARTWLLRAAAVKPGDPEVLFILGSMSAGQGKRDEALTYFDRALSLKSDFPAARRSRDDLIREKLFFKEVRDTLCEFARGKGLSASDVAELGDVEFPSASVDANGVVRFTMSLPASLILNDLGAAHLFYREVTGGGYEFSMRRFLDLHLRSDDLFVDVGAHWGIHSLTAATCRRREVSVLAVEAHPENAARLDGWVKRNRLEDDIEIIQAAIDDHEGTGRLSVDGSSMGHSLREGFVQVAPNFVYIRTTTLDRVLSDRAHLGYRGTILKLDVEGCELEALAGARELFSSGTVRAVIWEKASFYAPQVQEQRDKSIFDFLASHDFEHLCIEDSNGAQALVPFEGQNEPCNIYSLARGFERKDRYL